MSTTDSAVLRGSISRTVIVRDGEKYHEFLAQLEWSVWDLKVRLEAQVKTPAKEQHLYLGLTEVRNIDQLQDVVGNDEDAESIKLVFRSPDHASWFDYIKNNNGWMMSIDAPPSVKADRDIMLMSVGADGDFLRFARDSVISDSEVVYTAVCNWPEALRYGSKAVRGDRDIVTAAVALEGNSLRHARGALKSDSDVVLSAVRQDGWALHWAEEKFREDREVVLAAVRSRGRSLTYASAELRADKEVVLAAVAQDGLALEYADEALRKDGDVVIVAVHQNNKSLQYVDISLRNSRIVMHIAAGQLRAPWPATWNELVDWYKQNPDKVYPPKFRP